PPPSPSPSREPTPPPSSPDEPPVLLDIPRNHFVHQEAVDRYQVIWHNDFKHERRVSGEVMVFPLIQAEFSRRRWDRGNRTVALEFLSNAWRTGVEKPTRIVQ
ncbi:hypothetical protein A2U01_0060117, partial [Trifolium medium]|nr:hypothetical protein [Trifolium medium]